MARRLWRLITHRLARVRWLLAGLLATGVILACVLAIPQLLVRWELGASVRTLPAMDRAKAINDIRATLLQGLGGAVLLLGAYFTYQQLQSGRKQLQIAQQGQVTERFTRAIEQLGDDKVDIRLGGIYALERIARDSPDDRDTIIEVLTAFVRSHAPWPPRLAGQYRADAPIEQVPEFQVRAPDIRAALLVLARRDPPLSLSGGLMLHMTDLRSAFLGGAHLQGASLNNSSLQGARLTKANLQGALLYDADLQRAGLDGAQLQGAKLDGADLQGAFLDGADLQGASLRGANLQDTWLIGARFQNAQADPKTMWPADFDPEGAGVIQHIHSIGRKAETER